MLGPFRDGGMELLLGSRDRNAGTIKRILRTADRRLARGAEQIGGPRAKPQLGQQFVLPLSQLRQPTFATRSGPPIAVEGEQFVAVRL